MEGDPASQVFEIESGYIKLYKSLSDGRRQVLGFLCPGEICGLIVKEFYSCSAEALTDVTIRVHSRDVYLEGVLNDPDAVERIFDLTTDVMMELQNHLLILGSKRPVEKIATFLVNLFERTRQNNQACTEVYIPMTRMDIGDYLGLSMETACRALSVLKKDGVIYQWTRGFIGIRDIDRLKSYRDLGEFAPKY